MEKLNVLIVDNSIFYKKLLTQAVESTGLGLVVHKASNGSLALERLKQHKTDVVLLDMFIPGTDGIETLRIIRKEYPDVFVVISGAAGSHSAAQSLRALNMGALDCILKPTVADAEKSVENIKKQLQGLFTQIITRKYTNRGNSAAVSPAPGSQAVCYQQAPAIRTAPKNFLSGVDLVVIASSTGGPSALDTICKSLPESFNKPVLVVQHMPPELTQKLAQSLGRKCKLPVLEAGEGDPVRPGRIMIAPGGFHMVLQPGNSSSLVINLESTPPVNGVKPAADVLFRSMAVNCRGRRILAVILTGMGSDGMLGVAEMKKTCDCYCLAQSEKTCVVYGMPKSVVDAGLADAVDDLQSIPDHILDLCIGRR